MVLNDIIEQAAGRQSGGSDHGGKVSILVTPSVVSSLINCLHHRNLLKLVLLPSNHTRVPDLLSVLLKLKLIYIYLLHFVQCGG